MSNGGPAFPFVCQDHSKYQTADQGMTLRDYFAAKAMQIAISEHPYGSESISDEAARYSYAVADAMLKAREVQP